MKLPRVVIALGAVSLFTDVASEMVYPLFPTLLAAVGGGAMAVGALEGVGDATAAVLKLMTGRLADKPSRRKPLVLSGYGLSALIRPLIALAVAPWQIVAARFFDRIGKGLRSSARDALLASSVPKSEAAAAFGFHRAMDNLGATIGPLISYAFLTLLAMTPHAVVTFSLVPGLLAVATIALFVKGDGEPAPEARPDEPASRPRAPGALKSYLAILFVFAIANTSDAFLLVRLGELGVSDSGKALVWAMLSLVRALSAYPGGLLADRLGRVRAMQLGWLLYAITYALMARAESAAAFVPALIGYGFYYGCTEGAERAIVAELAPRAVIGSAFGRFHLATGIAMLPSNVLFGLAWQRIGAGPCLLVSAGAALCALAAMTVWARQRGHREAG